MSWAAAAAAAGSIGGGLLGGKGAKDAAKQQRRAAFEARQHIQTLNNPYINLGEHFAVREYKNLMQDRYGYNYLKNNPLFDAAVDHSSGVMSNAGASRGKFNSGGMVDALFQNYLSTGQGYVNDAYNRLATPLTVGQSAASLTGNTGANLIAGAGNAAAAGTMGQANAWAGGLEGLAGALGTYIGGYQPNAGFTAPAYSANPMMNQAISSGDFMGNLDTSAITSGF